MSQNYLFHKPQCEACERLQKFLTSHRIVYEAIDGPSKEGTIFMRTEDVWIEYYPALRVSGRLYEYSDLFSEKGELLADHVLEIVAGPEAQP